MAAPPFESWSKEEIKARLEPLDKWQWAFSEIVNGRNYNGFHIGERDELNNHYYAIFGAYNNIHCTSCDWIKFIAQWYWDQKYKTNA